jgi:hypothetical protein
VNEYGSLSEIVEVQEAGRHSANYFLSQGYRLLFVGQKTNLVGGDGRAVMPWVRRDAVYVVGRPSGVPHIDWADVPRAERMAAMDRAENQPRVAQLEEAAFASTDRGAQP